MMWFMISLCLVILRFVWRNVLVSSMVVDVDLQADILLSRKRKVVVGVCVLAYWKWCSPRSREAAEGFCVERNFEVLFVLVFLKVE